jgi:hypothetical protein
MVAMLAALVSLINLAVSQPTQLTYTQGAILHVSSNLHLPPIIKGE